MINQTKTTEDSIAHKPRGGGEREIRLEKKFALAGKKKRDVGRKGKVLDTLKRGGGNEGIMREGVRSGHSTGGVKKYITSLGKGRQTNR